MNIKDELSLLRAVQDILSKLTPGNFYASLLQIEEMKIIRKESLQRIVYLVYEKAIEEPNICAFYALLCDHLKQIKVYLPEEEEYVNFKHLLLIKCQEELEQDEHEDTNLCERTKCFGNAMVKNRKELASKSETREEYNLRRKLASVQFIGELFKFHMFSEKTIHDNISKLLNQGDEMSLECMCRLLSIAGKELETRVKKMSQEVYKSSKDIMNEYMIEMQKIVDERQTSIRIRFILMDTISLRKNLWQPRRGGVGPKTINQIFIEADMKAQKEQLMKNLQFSKKPPNSNPGNNATVQERPEIFELNIKRIQPVIEKFLCTEDFKNTINSIMELYSPNTTHYFISSAIILVICRSKQDRYSLGQLLHKLVHFKRVELEQYNAGLISVLAQIDDCVARIPLIWDYFADIIEPMMEGHYIPMSFLKETLQPFSPSQLAAKIMAAVLRCVSKNGGMLKARAMWRDSELQWGNFLPPSENLSKFLKAQAVEFTIHPMKVQYPTDDMFSVASIKKKLDFFFKTDFQNIKQIVNWIETYINVKSNGPNFVDALVHTVFENAISRSGQTYELDTEKLKLWLPIIEPYVACKPEFEYHTLDVLQTLILRLNYPRGLLNHVFDILYDTEIISDKTFFAWEGNQNPHIEKEMDALNSVYPFFTWLREATLTSSSTKDIV